jgi:hypothetical protein
LNRKKHKEIEGTPMMNLRDLFENKIHSNVYHLHSSVQLTDISAIAPERKFTQFVLDGSQITSKREFFQHFGTVMQPPNVFVDWDYLERQLEVTEWLQEQVGVIITYKNVELFFKTNQKEFDVLTDIFLCVTNFRNKRGIPPLIIFVQGDEAFKTIVPLELVTLPHCSLVEQHDLHHEDFL